jgi:photosystem II stability/assembly factor-like uncharacterized protein
MKKLILFELIFIFLATTFISDNPPGWYQQNIPIGNRLITDIYFLDKLTGWVVTNNPNGTDSSLILKTTDGGNNWNQQFKNYYNFNAIQFVDANTGYAATRQLYKTTNGGLNWNLSVIAGFDFQDVFFVNKDTGWVCDADAAFGVGILKTINGGINWSQQAGSSYRPKKLFFINPDTGWAGSNEANGKLYRTTNGGTNWNLQYTFNSNTYGMYFTTKDTGFIAGVFSSSSIAKTINGGFNWIPTNNATGGNDIFFITKKTGYNCAVFSTVEKTTDGGVNWFQQTVPSGNYYSIKFTDTSKGWAGGSNLIHTMDGGGPTGIHNISTEIPADFKLYQNYPNPFNPKTKFSYELRVTSYVKLVVFDVSGKQISELINQKQNAGIYEVDFGGTGLSSGIYFYSLFADGKLIDTKKMVLIK